VIHEMSYLRRAIANKQWGKVVKLFSLGIVVGIILFFGLRFLFEIGTIEFLLAVLFLTFIGDFVLAWDIERGIKQGNVKLKNDIIGNIVVADEEFLEYDGRFKGKVRIGLERWTAFSDSPISAGAQVTVSGRDGLILHVENRV